MDKNEMPLGFGFALAQDPEAMRKFSQLPEAKRAEILQQAHSVTSKGQMQALVRGLSAQ